ncbi:MAG: rhamnulokinase family protein [Eubacterium sp.]
MTYHLAIDIGASSGRHILGYIDNGKLRLEEIYRFENYIKNESGTLVWDIKHLVNSVISGIAKCREIGKIPETVAIDTWGVDYVILDKDKKEILPAVSYRDGRTNAVTDIISQKELYFRTGIQKQSFNTIYQLYCDKLSGKLDSAEHFLMIPDYLSFKLTGVIKNEYTNATTTNLVNAKTKTWDTDILDELGIKNIFCDLSLPKTVIGNFTGEIKKRLGFDSTVIYCPSHDTASAVAACPIGDNSVYISSGTWSLIGTENLEPVLTDDALSANFTNEGGIDYRFRFLKNIMGMWLLQSIRRDLNKKFTYDDMMRLAIQSRFVEQINPNAHEFVAPDNMINAVRRHLNNESLSVDGVINSVYHSLAQSYADAVNEIEAISGKTIDTINIVGGGSKDSYLNKLTKEYTGKCVLAGPVEATATGNIICQLMYADDNLTLEKARELVKNSFDIMEVK